MPNHNALCQKRISALIIVIAAQALISCSDSDNDSLPDGSATADAVTLSDLGTQDGAASCINGLPCSSPFVCRVKDGNLGCYSAEGDIPSCGGTPAGQVVPFLTTPGDKAVHWAIKPGCILTSYDPQLAAKASDIAAAVKAWSDVSCSALCFSPPTESSTLPDQPTGERRMHYLLDSTIASQNYGVARSNYETSTGRIYTAEVRINPNMLNAFNATRWVQLTGMALGLSLASSQADTVMAPDSNLTAPNSNDEAALCKLYGTPSYCGD